MREKLRYTPAQIRKGLYTTGQEWQTADGTEYIGLYHRYTTGEVFTETEWNPNKSVKLFPYESVSPAVMLYKRLKGEDINVKFQSTNEYQPEISGTDSIITRYFISKQNEFNIQEIDSTQFELFLQGKLDNIMYTAVKIPWKVVGYLQNRTVNGVIEQGIYEHNMNSIQVAKNQIPNIDKYLTDPLELATDIQYDIPTDINT